MLRNFIAVMWVCLAVGCIDHAQARADNVKMSVEHSAALDKCYDDAIATKQKSGDLDKATAEYIACANAADRQFGRVKR